MAICVTGTPGTGKTSLSRLLEKVTGYKRIDVKRLIVTKKLAYSYDKERRCLVVDTRKLTAELKKVLSKNDKVIIDSLLSHHLPKKYVSTCFVTKCDLAVLNKRLEKRKYSKKKIRENLDAEIFDICLTEAQQNRHHVAVINTTKGIKRKEVLSLLSGVSHESAG